MTALWQGRHPAPAPWRAKPCGGERPQGPPWKMGQMLPHLPSVVPPLPPPHPSHRQNKPQKRICFSFLPRGAGPHGAPCICLLSLPLSEGKTLLGGGGSGLGVGRGSCAGSCSWWSLPTTPQRDELLPKEEVSGCWELLHNSHPHLLLRMNRPLPPNSYAGSPNPSGAVSGDAAFTEVIRVKWGHQHGAPT